MGRKTTEQFLQSFATITAYRTRGIPRELPLSVLVMPQPKRSDLLRRMSDADHSVINWVEETSSWFEAFDHLLPPRKRMVRRVILGLSQSLSTITRMRIRRDEDVVWADPTLGLARVYSPRSLHDMLSNQTDIRRLLGKTFRLPLNEPELQFLTRANILRPSPPETAHVLPHRSSLRSWKQIDNAK